ncbi:hypothetical protein [Klebsiella aerogenes]|uniref:hypothetical protein n=1 Tax=Klebsiella aerogenes TaxID=548 RepID=UPI00351D2936
MDITQFSNIHSPAFTDGSGQYIDVVADIEGIGQSVTFTASQTDRETHGRELWQNAMNGDYGDIAAYAPPVKSEAEIQSEARQYRDRFIYLTDRMTLVDYAIDDEIITDAQKQEALSTRAAFRGWPKQPGWPHIPLPDVPGWMAAELTRSGFTLPVWPEN